MSVPLNKIGYAAQPKDKMLVPMSHINKIKGKENLTLEDVYFSEEIHRCKNNRVKVVAMQYRNKPTPMVYAQLCVKVSNYTNLYIEEPWILTQVAEDIQEAALFISNLVAGNV